eukprot:4049121-Pyramimonas_sp.AAC.1
MRFRSSSMGESPIGVQVTPERHYQIGPLCASPLIREPHKQHAPTRLNRKLGHVFRATPTSCPAFATKYVCNAPMAIAPPASSSSTLPRPWT